MKRLGIKPNPHSVIRIVPMWVGLYARPILGRSSTPPGAFVRLQDSLWKSSLPADTEGLKSPDRKAVPVRRSEPNKGEVEMGQPAGLSPPDFRASETNPALRRLHILKVDEVIFLRELPFSSPRPGGGMVDTGDLKSPGRKAVPVRVRPRAPSDL